jgi:hypothetical protein
VAAADIPEADARAGYPSRQARSTTSAAAQARDLPHRTRRHHGRPRVALRAQAASADDLRDLRNACGGWTNAPGGPWTTQVLRLIARNPGGGRGTSAGDGAGDAALQGERAEAEGARSHRSLEVGYRLSPRGTALLDTLGPAALS